MPVNEFIPLKDAKITTEKEVRPRKSIAELTTIESPGRPSPADQLEDLEDDKTKKKARAVKKQKAEAKEIKVKKEYLMIITEKPQAAQKIALAISPDARKYTEDGASYFELVSDEGKKILVASAVGHLFNLTYAPGQKGWPIFNLIWQPSYERKTSAFTKKYYNLLKKLSKKAKEFIIATDFDIEGEVIGWNILRFICNEKTAKRMKYSTLTKDELKKAFDSPLPTPDWGNAYAGESRHFLDWLYCINLSRALMSSLKHAGIFKILSIGRVQGPALKIIIDREREIDNFKSVPFWQVFADIDWKDAGLVEPAGGCTFKHPKDIFDKKELEKFRTLEGKDAEATTTEKEENIQLPFP